MSTTYKSCGDKSCCDQCQTCDDCDGGTHGECNVKQNFCSTNQNAAAATGFSNPWGTFTSGQSIIEKLPRSKYNAILNCIKAAYNKGDLADSGLTMSVTPETGNFITADKTNQIIDAINALNGQVISKNEVPTLVKDVHIVYASYFNAISSGLMSMTLKEIQCDYCNVECDAQCKTCDACDTCDTGACYTCVTCNICNSVSTWSCSQWAQVDPPPTPAAEGTEK